MSQKAANSLGHIRDEIVKFQLEPIQLLFKDLVARIEGLRCWWCSGCFLTIEGFIKVLLNRGHRIGVVILIKLHLIKKILDDNGLLWPHHIRLPM